MSLKNARQLGVRLDADDAATLQEIEEQTFIDGVSVARASLKATLAYWRVTKKLSLPLYMSDKPVLTDQVAPTKPANLYSLQQEDHRLAAEQTDGQGPKSKQPVRYPRPGKPRNPPTTVGEAISNVVAEMKGARRQPPAATDASA